MSLNPETDDQEDTCPWSYDEDSQLLQSVMAEATEQGLSFFQKPDLSRWDKSPDNPVSEADIALDAFLKKTLHHPRPGYGWLSEETRDNPERLRCDRLWIVDPIDGTRAFIDGSDDWAISVALVENGRPVLGAVYAPARKQYYFAQKGKGAFLNDKKVTVSGQSRLEEAVMMGDAAGFKGKHWPVSWPRTIVYSKANSIALRLCCIAAGIADCCVTLRPKNDWDVAAADLILREAGGILQTGSGDFFVYNKTKPFHDHIIASNGLLQPAIDDRVKPALDIWRKE